MSALPPQVKRLLDQLSSDSSEHALTLYHYDGCGFCYLVRREAERLGVELHLVSIFEQPEARKMLMQRRGRGTVPVLGVPTAAGEELLPESDDIVRFLEAYVARSRS